MKYNFHVVDIYLFDVHTAVKPLIAKDCVRKELDFLLDPQAYNQQYSSRDSLQTNAFKIKPLTYNSRQYNHFWKNYMSVWPIQRPDYWKLQVPFTFQPNAADLSVTLEEPSYEVKVRPTVYVSTLGWSTNLTLQLKGNMRLEQIRSLIARLRAKDESGYIFQLGTERLNLSSVYKHFSSKIRETLYKPSRPVTLDTTNLHSHLIVSLSNFTGSVYYYKGKWQNEGERMTNADQALLHSILHGREIDVKEFAHITRTSKFSVVHFTGADLALSYFNLGTLVFMQQSVLRRSNRKTSMSCLGSNIRSCSMMTLMFMYFYGQAKKFPESKTSLRELLVNIENNLRLMPDSYTNAFCKKLYSNHSDLSQMRSRT